MTGFKPLVKKCGKAVFDFNMINENDNILVCFSGGKDSYFLLKVFEYFKRTYPIDFTFKVLVINPNFDKTFEKRIRDILNNQNIEYEIIDSKINDVIDKQSKIKKLNPCFMCSRLRRGIIYDYAIKNNFNKIALGHNLDDAIETHLINLFFGSKTSFLKPKYKAENNKIEVIRPMIYLDEDYIMDFINNIQYSPVKNICPMKKENSKRDYFKQTIIKLKANNPKVKESCYHAFKNTKELNSWEQTKEL